MIDHNIGGTDFLPLYFFEKISEIPRGSGNEDAICDYIMELARKHGLDATRDGENNILIRKEASSGRENEESILLQAHTDMVCEKNEATVHDFKRDKIKLIRNGNILSADNTTLGADDGFGVSLMLAILTDNSISTPPIECLFTSREEIGLVGASAYDYSGIRSKYLINLDSAEEDTVIIGCCGGIRTEMTYPVTFTESHGYGYKIEIGGLCGGHSGEDIDKGRTNSNILMGSVLKRINSHTPLRISYVSGGDKDNAIPRECKCTVATDKDIDSFICEIIREARAGVTATEDEGVYLNIEKCDTLPAISYSETQNVIKVLNIDNGVLKYRDTAPILPEASRNLARIRTGKDAISFGFSSRSSISSLLEKVADGVRALADEIGADSYHHESYPGWESDSSSSLVTRWSKAYERVKGSVPKVTLIHAGLECGIITSRVAGMDAISIGCNVHDLHTPKETMELDSFERVYGIMLEFLS